MRNIVIRIAINALALWAAAGILDGIELAEGFWQIVLVAAIFGLVNAIVKPIAVVLSLPFIVLTVGLILIVINALMLLLTDAITDSLTVDGFGTAVLGALIISVISWAAGLVLPDGD